MTSFAAFFANCLMSVILYSAQAWQYHPFGAGEMPLLFEDIVILAELVFKKNSTIRHTKI